MNILVTGASGFVGSHLARHLLALGHRVSVLDQPGASLAPLAGLDVAHHVGDVTDADSLARAVVTSSVGAVGGDPSGHAVDETFAYAWPDELQYFATKRDAEAVCRRAAANGQDRARLQ